MDLTLSDTRKQARQIKPTPRKESPDTPLDYDLLFEQHWEGLVQALTRLVGDPDEAQDLVLEAFLRLHNQPPSERQNLGGWLYRVATNLGLNSLRARKRRRRYEEQAGVLTLEYDKPLDPLAALERRQEQRQVRLTLSNMKRRNAQILILRYSGLSYAEISAALGIKSSSVGTLLSRAEREFERKYELTFNR
jgi:RNA polymerase sigma-70 factor (ECF subfamily)